MKKCVLTVLPFSLYGPQVTFNFKKRFWNTVLCGSLTYVFYKTDWFMNAIYYLYTNLKIDNFGSKKSRAIFCSVVTQVSQTGGHMTLMKHPV